MRLHHWLAAVSDVLWPFLLNHLWQATVFSILLVVGLGFVRRGAARTRYVIWSIASAKFLLPSVLFVMLGSQLGIQTPRFFQPRTDAKRSPAVVVEMGLVNGMELSAASATFRPAAHDELYCCLTLLWIAGVFVCAARWWVKRRRFVESLRAAEQPASAREIATLKRVSAWLGINRRVDIIVSPGVTEPGVWRTIAPVVVMPWRLSEELSDPELEAVLMHELVHVRRWDNLVSNLQRLACSVFWFHPFVWLAGRRMLAERERACDEAVVEISGAPEVYASGILKVCRLCVGRQELAGVSCAGGSDLKRRIEGMIANGSQRRKEFWGGALVAASVALLLVFSVLSSGSARASSTSHKSSDAKASAQARSGGVSGGVPGGVPGGVVGGVTGGVQGGVPGGVPGGVVWIDAKKFSEMSQKVDQMPEIAVRFTNADDAPMVVLNAGIKVLVDEATTAESADARMRQLFWIAKRVEVVNNSNKTCTSLSVVLRISPGEDREPQGRRHWIELLSQIPVKIGPGEQITLNAVSVRPMPQPEDISSGVITISGASFDDGSSWGESGQSRGFGTGSGSGYSMGGGIGSVPPGDRAPSGTGAGPSTVRKSPGVMQQSAMIRVEPEYPPLAKAAQVSGSVVVEILVDENGDVESARAVNGHPLLRSAAVDAAKQWKFKPTTIGGNPVKVTATLTFNFQM